MKKEMSHKGTGSRRMFMLLDMAVLLLAILPAIVSCSRRDIYRADHGVPQCEITGSLDSLFGSIFKPGEPGGIICVTRNDSVVYKTAFGMARLDSAERITDSTIFNISSASKIFTSAALLKLADLGTISLDDPLAKYFPEFPENIFKKITIRHILTHSSGLPDMRPLNMEQWNRYLTCHNSVFGHDKDYRLYGTEDEHMQIFQNLDTVAFEAGTHYQRDDPAYILVAPLIERITGQSFDRWMRDSIFNPADMPDAFYFRAGSRRPRLAHGYTIADPSSRPRSFRSNDGRWDEYDYGEADYFLTKADRGACSTARGFLRWNKALRCGKIISDSSLKLMESPIAVTDIPDTWYGLGTAIYAPDSMPRRIYHMNSNGGFTAMEIYWPDRDVGCVVFSNRNDWKPMTILHKLDSIFMAKDWI